MRLGTDRQTHRHTDGRDPYTFRFGYASREMQKYNTATHLKLTQNHEKSTLAMLRLNVGKFTTYGSKLLHKNLQYVLLLHSDL